MSNRLLEKLFNRAFHCSSDLSPRRNHHHRRLHCEQLEDRRMLSIGPYPELPGMVLVDPVENQFAGQIVYLDFDGAQGVDYNGPVVIEDIDIPAFEAPGELAGQEQQIITEVVAQLETTFADTGIIFTTVQPAECTEYSTIYIGGDDSAFEEYGAFFGLAEQVDIGNSDQADDAMVFAESLQESPFQLGQESSTQVANIVGHELAHLLGYEHQGVTEQSAGSLADVAFEPVIDTTYTSQVPYDINIGIPGVTMFNGNASWVDPDTKFFKNIATMGSWGFGLNKQETALGATGQIPLASVPYDGWYSITFSGTAQAVGNCLGLDVWVGHHETIYRGWVESRILKDNEPLPDYPIAQDDLYFDTYTLEEFVTDEAWTVLWGAAKGMGGLVTDVAAVCNRIIQMVETGAGLWSPLYTGRFEVTSQVYMMAGTTYQWDFSTHSMLGAGTVGISGMSVVETFEATLEDISVQPISAPPIYSVVVSSGANGSVSPSGESLVEPDTDLTFFAEPDWGYTVDEWKMDGTVLAWGVSAVRFAGFANHMTLDVSFKRIDDLAVTASSGAHGSISPALPTTVPFGESYTLYADPDPNYVVKNWFVNGRVVANSEGAGSLNLVGITIPCDVVVEFEFSASTHYSGGDGSETSPYQIATVNDLLELRITPEDYDSHFVLTSDIDLSGKTFGGALIARNPTSSEEFAGTPFTGTFDGNNHVISNLTIETWCYDYLGLFGYVGPQGAIKNLGVGNVAIIGGRYSWYLGGLAGKNDGTVEQCYTTGEVIGREVGGSYMGGLIGSNYGSVSNSYSTCMVNGASGAGDVGGLVGAHWNGIIQYCYSRGPVARGNAGPVGGLVGRDIGATVSSFYDADTAEVHDGGGTGLSTDAMHQIDTYIDASWDIASSAGSNAIWNISLNGYPMLTEVPEYAIRAAEIRIEHDSNTLFDGDISAKSENGTIFDSTYVGTPVVHSFTITNLGKTDLMLGVLEVPEGYAVTENFPSYLGAGEQVGFSIALIAASAGIFSGEVSLENGDSTESPFAFVISGQVTQESGGYSGGSGTREAPYLIATVEDLLAFGNTPEDYDSHFALISDIDLSGHVFTSSIIAPDLDSTNYKHDGSAFMGTFDGRYHVISNLIIEAGGSDDYLGLFGAIDVSASIRNLGVENIQILDGGHHIGGIAGAQIWATGFASTTPLVAFSQCYTTGVLGKKAGGCIGGNVGGIVGVLDYSVMENCYSTVDMVSVGVGGLVGGTYDSGTITHSYYAGTQTEYWSTQSTNYPFSGRVGGGGGSSIIGSLWDREKSPNSFFYEEKYDYVSNVTSYMTSEMFTEMPYAAAEWDLVGNAGDGIDDIWYIPPSGYAELAGFHSELPDRRPNVRFDALLGNFSFAIEYQDDNLVDISSIGDSDILVTGPNGYSEFAKLVQIDKPSNSTPINAVYQITPPNDAWSKEDNGEYSISVVDEEVYDTDGYWAQPKDLAAVTVSIPNASPEAFIDSIIVDALTSAATVRFVGHGTDSDGSVETYSWHSDIDGIVGEGNMLAIPLDALSVGEHTITLYVTDDDGANGWISDSLVVNNVLPTADILDVPSCIEPGEAFTITLVGQDGDEDGESIVDAVLKLDGVEVSRLKPGNTYDITASSVEDTYTLTYQVQDNEGTWSIVATKTFIVANAGVWFVESNSFTAIVEGAASDAYEVALASAPTANVIITLAVDSQVGVDKTMLTFTPSNWDQPQTVTVTAVDDDMDENSPHIGTITHTASSTDAVYNGIGINDLTVNITDNDTAGITVNPISGLTTTEAGGTATFTVVLNSEPTANVTLNLSSSDTTEGTVLPASLIFTSSNWNTPQTVTVTSVDDLIVDGNMAYTIVTAAATSADVNYSGLNAADVSVTNNDDDTGITASGPKISGVMVVETNLPRDGVLKANDPLVMTFNAVDADGVAGATLSIDGLDVPGVGGPYASASGFNFGALLGTLSAGTHYYSIVATNTPGHPTATAYTGSFEVGPADMQGPAISGVMVVEENTPRDGILRPYEGLLMTFNAVDPDGVDGATLKIDGNDVTPVGGPYASASGANFGVILGTLVEGTHNYSIAATDQLGNPTATAYTGSFDVVVSASSLAGPKISGVMVVEELLPRDGDLKANDSLVLTFNAVDPDGVAGATLSIDGVNVPGVAGPYASASGDNFGALLGTLSEGTHNYSIVATDTPGHTTATAYTGSFEVGPADQQGPAISGVMVVEENEPRDGILEPDEGLLMTFNAVDADGVAGATLKIDGNDVTPVGGPYASDSGANFGVLLGMLPAGTHNYSIVATDNHGNPTSPAYTGSFDVAAALFADASAVPQGAAAPLTDQQLAAIVVEAERRLATVFDTQVLTAMAGVNIQIADLPGGLLGEALGKTILIDRDAAGYGWFVDPTPSDDLEYADLITPHTLAARNDSTAAQRVDLLTTVMHEIGHVLGCEHSDSLDLMYPTLSLGTRRLSDGQYEFSPDGLGSDLLQSNRLINANALDLFFAEMQDDGKNKWSTV